MGSFAIPSAVNCGPILQCLNHWVFWALFGAAILAGTFALVPALVALLLSLPLPDRIP